MSRSRKTRLIGLSSKAQDFLAHANNGMNPEPTPTGDHYRGVHEEPIPLHAYETQKGKLTEYVQAVPWLGGPVVFLALRKEDDPVDQSLWSDDEMDSTLLGSN